MAQVVSTITLSFVSVGSCRLELIRSEVRFLDCSSVAAVRRAAPAVRDGFGSFIWSAGVRGFSLLCSRTALFACMAGSQKVKKVAVPELSGEGGSIAAALDRAINKPADWITELFGVYPARNLFRRENSERKRAGPVRISLNAALCAAGAIEIFLDGNRCTTSEQLKELSSKLESADSDSSGSVVSNREVAAPFLSTLIDTLSGEAYDQLLGGGTALMPKSRLGTGQKSKRSRQMRSKLQHAGLPYARGTTVHVFSVPSAVGANLILAAVARTLGITLQWIWAGATSDLLDPALRVINQKGSKRDAHVWVVLSRGAAAKLRMSKRAHQLKPVLDLARSSLELVAPPGERPIERVFVSGSASGYPRQYLQFLSAIKHPRLSCKVKFSVAPLNKLLSTLRKHPGAGVIVAAPYAQLICQERGLSHLEMKVSAPHFISAENHLYASEGVSRDAFTETLRSAWLSLLQKPSLRLDLLREIYGSTAAVDRIASLLK